MSFVGVIVTPPQIRVVYNGLVSLDSPPALDAHCLLGVYEHLATTALALDPDFNVAPYFRYKPHPQNNQDTSQ